MKRRAILLAALLAAGCGTIAGPPPLASGPFPTTPSTDSPIEAAAGGYILDPRHTSVIWRVRHQNMSMFTGRFNTIAGSLDFNPAAPAQSRLAVTIDAASVDTGLKGKDAGFDSEIAEALGVKKTPQISFVSQRVTRTGPHTGLVSGDLTMNGVTRPAVFETTFENYVSRTIVEPRPVIAFGARAVIRRSDWGATNTVFSLFAGDEVEVIVETEMVRG